MNECGLASQYSGPETPSYSARSNRSWGSSYGHRRLAPMRPLTVPLVGLPLVPMKVSWPADTKLSVRGTTATRKRHSGSQ
jgi:hypothetical protein